MTAIDPILDCNTAVDDIICIKKEYHYKLTDISQYDAVIAQEPCEATEHIVRSCTESNKDFIISLCGVPHKLINGKIPDNAHEWYDYLKNINNNCFIIQSQIIPDYLTPIMIGMFKKNSI